MAQQRLDERATKHLKFLREFRFTAKASKHKGKFVVQVDFKKIRAVLKLKNLWQCESFVLGSPSETDLKPEGQSKHLVYQYLTS